VWSIPNDGNAGHMPAQFPAQNRKVSAAGQKRHASSGCAASSILRSGGDIKSRRLYGVGRVARLCADCTIAVSASAASKLCNPRASSRARIDRDRDNAGHAAKGAFDPTTQDAQTCFRWHLRVFARWQGTRGCPDAANNSLGVKTPDSPAMLPFQRQG